MLRSTTVAPASMIPFGLARAATLPPPSVRKEIFQMNLSRFVLLTISAALMLSAGSSSSATANNYQHPTFSVSEGRTLDLRETGSKIVMETIEDALQQGGVALLGEGFQIDSSLGWVFGEDIKSIEGGIDAAIPLFNKNGHIVFTQPGLVFWEGLAEEERIDANLGIVYRTNLANTPVGLDAVAGASLFYDYDFHRVGHERLGIGADIQTDNFHGAFNYYHPLSNEEDGREGFLEEALKGADLRVALERSVVRAGARVGLWRYDGGEDVADEWRASVGVDAGLRIFPGVFIEGDWEKHQEDLILDQRFKLGLAFRFSLPGFEGRSYAGGSMSTDLYKVVDREKRILYEERESGPRVSIVRSGSEAVAEGGTVELAVQLSEPLEENVTINLIGSGSATYGEIAEDGDWLLDNGSGNCVSVAEDNCQVMIPAGEDSVGGVEITINDDGRTNEPAEDIILSMVIASGDTDLTARGSFSLAIPRDPPLPAVNLSSDNTSLGEGDTATITLTLNETLESDATFNLIGGSDSNDVTYGTSGDWNLDVGGTDCDMASESNPCPVVISRGDTTAEVTVEINTDSTAESSENFSVSVVVDSGSMSIVQAGDASVLPFTISDNNTIKFASSTLTVTESQASFGNLGFIDIVLSSNLPAGVQVTLVIGGNAEDGDYGIIASNRQIPSGADYTNGVYTFPTNTMEARLVFEATGETASPDTDNEEITIQLTDPNNNLPPGWSIVEPSTVTVTITDEG